MYDDRTLAIRRILRFVLVTIIIVGLIWLVSWFIFFREPNAKDTTKKDDTSTSQSSNSSSSSPSNSGGSSSSGSSSSSSTPSTPSSGSSSSTSGNTSGTSSNSSSSSNSHLANTGPEHVWMIAGAAGVAASAFYYIRLHRKLVRS